MDFLSIFGLICSFMAGIGVSIVFLKLVKREALSMKRREASSKGNEVIKEQGERFAAAAVRAMELMNSAEYKIVDEAGKEKLDYKKVLLVLVSEYPDVGLKLLTSIVKGKGMAGIGGLQEMFSGLTNPAS